MTDRVIIFDNGLGGVAIKRPSLGAKARRPGMSDDEFYQFLIDTRIPPGQQDSASTVLPSALPKDRAFRQAWVKVGNNVDVDMPKARTIHMNRIRVARDAELERLDKESMLNMEQGVNNAQTLVDKQKLRDIPQTFDLEQFATPDELQVAWPVGLPRS